MFFVVQAKAIESGEVYQVRRIADKRKRADGEHEYLPG